MNSQQLAYMVQTFIHLGLTSWKYEEHYFLSTNPFGKRRAIPYVELGHRLVGAVDRVYKGS